MPETITPEAMKLFASDSKIALIAVRDESGYPHITMMSTLMAKDEKSVMFGQFCEGLSKKFIHERPKTAFLLMSVDKEMWRGKAVFTGTAATGPEFDIFNSKPLFRYNTYFGIGRVYYLDLVEITEKEALPMGAVIRSALVTRCRKGGVRGNENGALSHISRALADGLATLKFIAAEDEQGFCNITPIVQAASSTDGRIVFTRKPYADELKKLKPGQKAAVFAMNLSLESVLIKGVYRGLEKGLCVLDAEKVYNPLMPLPGYIYPKPPLREVAEFE
jgi:hypothetical protein